MFEENRQELVTLGYTTLKLGDSVPLRELIRSLSSEHPLEQTHLHCSPEKLNDLRLQAFARINDNNLFRKALLASIKPIFENLLGPDLCVQRNFNLVISMPGDETSQIPMHADTWTGHSPFELVLWIPLTKVKNRQSMYLLPLPAWKERRGAWIKGTMQETLMEMQPHLHHVELDPGEALIFWHNLPHGNVSHHEEISRWSLNLRAKNIFTPYSQRALGDYFIPWTMGPLTQMILNEKVSSK